MSGYTLTYEHRAGGLDGSVLFTELVDAQAANTTPILWFQVSNTNILRVHGNGTYGLDHPRTTRHASRGAALAALRRYAQRVQEHIASAYILRLETEIRRLEPLAGVGS